MYRFKDWLVENNVIQFPSKPKVLVPQETNSLHGVRWTRKDKENNEPDYVLRRSAGQWRVHHWASNAVAVGKNPDEDKKNGWDHDPKKLAHIASHAHNWIERNNPHGRNKHDMIAGHVPNPERAHLSPVK